MEVKKGYKKTNIGIIPNDWEVKPLMKISTAIGDGIHTTPVYTDNSEIYFINGNNLNNGTIQLTEDTLCVSKDEYKKYKIDLGDKSILLSINGTIGNLAYFDNERVILGKSAAYININDNVEKDYIFYILGSFSISEYFNNELTGSTIRNLSLFSLRNTPIPLPPLPEQRAIAEVLSDVDALIAAQEALIAKKRAIKQGVMQELLTGKRRLPGFSGEWKEKTLGEIVVIRKGQLITEDTAIDGNIPVIAGGKQPSYFHNTANRYGRTITISASGANAGYVAFHQTPIFASDCSTISQNENYDIRFIYQFLLLSQEFIYRLQSGGAQPHIHPSDVNPFLIKIPPLSEQHAIADILSDLDHEINILDQSRNKTILLKQGMMQELLTGRIRLTGVSHEQNRGA